MEDKLEDQYQLSQSCSSRGIKLVYRKLLVVRCVWVEEAVANRSNSGSAVGAQLCIISNFEPICNNTSGEEDDSNASAERPVVVAACKLLQVHNGGENLSP